MTRTPRERIVLSAAQLVRIQGVGATGMRDVVAHAEAPRGSLQHYFPGGKDQLMAEAVAWAGGYAARRVARIAAKLENPTPGKLFAAMAAQWRDEFTTTGFDAGCPWWRRSPTRQRRARACATPSARLSRAGNDLWRKRCHSSASPRLAASRWRCSC